VVRPKIFIELLLVTVTVIWGTNLAVIKLLYEYFDPLAFNAVRLTLAVVTMLFILWMRGIPLQIARGDLPALVGLGILSNTAYQLLFSVGLDRTRAGNVGLLMALVPIFAYIAGLTLRRETFNRRIVAGILLSVAGAMAIVLVGGTNVSLSGTWQGDLLIVGASTCWGWFTGSSTTLIARYGAMRFTTLTMMFGVGLLLPITVPRLLEQDWTSVPAIAWVGLAGSAWLAIVFNFFVWTSAIRLIGGSRTAVIGNLTPIVAILAGWALLGERPVPAQGISIILIFAGIHLVRTAGTARSIPASEVQETL
jgi:drug/metabolite transporter (DMT)-like permease